MKRAIVEAWVKGKKKKTYTFYYTASVETSTREKVKARAIQDATKQFGRFYPAGTEWKISH